ncbi:MAG: hypothetical protein QOE22_497 [Candidatus Parcubacteria bacterium]|jgi:signal transduction histidine kinase/sensor domain CHASE-containing protein|nr:hypothetical protein [Candidatus Parcubacteria bacterium]
MKEKRYLSVRAKILSVIAVSVVVLCVLMYAIATQVLTRSYLAIERDDVLQNLDRATDTVREFEDNWFLNLQDWSPWSDLYDYTLTRDPVFEEETLFALGFVRQDQNGFFLADNEGRIFLAHVLDLEQETEVSSSTVVAYLENHRDLIVHGDPEHFTKGLVMLPEGPAVIVSKPVLKNDNTGPINASVSMLRFLDERKVQDFADVTHLAIQVFPFEGNVLPEDVQEAKRFLSKANPNVITPVSDEVIHGYRLLYDVYGNPILILRIEMPRPIHTQGQGTLVFFLIIGAAALLLFGLGMTGLLEKFVVRRFVSLTRDVEKINNEKDISMRVGGDVRDDIGRLADKINRMLGWLSAAQDAEAKSKREVVALLEDIKHGKERAEEMVVERTRELRDEKARLAASIDSLTFGFVITDMENRILFRNPALTAVLGLTETPDALEGIAPLFTQTSGENTDAFDLLAFVRGARASGKITENKCVSFGKKYLRFLCAPVLAEGKTSAEVIGFVLVIEDITEAKNTERSREEFFAIASHELRTPLTAIRWNSDMLLKKERMPQEAEEKAMLKDIYDSSLRLISIVRDFLEVSQLEQGKMETKKEEFDVCEVVEKTIRNLEKMAIERKLKLSSVPPIPGTNTRVVGDRDRVEQVLDNLIGNALKFTDTGSVTVRTESLGDTVKVSVTDTGIGISPHNQSRLFRKFEQAGENMLARKANQSTGLGLYISKLIMTAMHGTVTLEKSALGEGSTFAFTLPAAQGQDIPEFSI